MVEVVFFERLRKKLMGFCWCPGGFVDDFVCFFWLKRFEVGLLRKYSTVQWLMR